MGGKRALAPLPPLEVVVAERRGLEDQISMQPWLSLELALLVEEAEEGMVVKEGMCCKQLGGCCSWVWLTGLEVWVVQLLLLGSWTGSGFAGEPACCI